jgi:hypothetical protein
MKIILGLSLSILFTACTALRTVNSQEYTAGGDDKQNIKEKDGKCYAKAMIPDTYGEKKEYVAVYTGEKIVEGIVQKTIQTKPITNKWVKKTADRNCLSANPNDCLIWCLVEVPGESETLNIVTDTSKIKDFVMRPINITTLKEAGGVTKYVEILCPAEQTNETMRLICTKLTAKGYLQKEQIVSFTDPKITAALTTFQKDMGLPVGQFNMPTLKALGIR